MDLDPRLLVMGHSLYFIEVFEDFIDILTDM